MKDVILLVDDHEEILEYISRFLEEKYQILTAPDGAVALDIANRETVHLIISDVMMPVMDGFQFCRALKENVETSHIPILLLTAKNTLQSRIEGLEIGADAYMEKPFSPEHLQVQIASLLMNRNKVKQYFASSPFAHIHSMAYTKADEHFLERIQEVILNHIADVELDVEHLAKYVNMSRPTLYRKLKEISDLTPNEMINLTRLKRAVVLLKEAQLTVAEISEQTGYASPTVFARSFQRQFGVNPSEFA
ncbi:MAG: response regulator transcription factor [Chitinophagaceae bacterium]|nr:MAG: response regulator transcription factor [Chitinophagaceae bacterium]